MNGRFENRQFLLDTNIIIAILNRDYSITRQLTRDMILFVPCIALGEAFSGAYRSGRIRENIQAVKTISERFPILPCNKGTAEAYGTLHSYVKKKGKPIPENDLWIAAIAHQRGFTLITRDNHFRHIEHLSIIVW
jgi:tRNA(fMet)-specific endonuclease VapC